MMRFATAGAPGWRLRATVFLWIWSGRVLADPALLVLDQGTHEVVYHPDLEEPCEDEYTRFGFGVGPAFSAFALPRGPNRAPALLVSSVGGLSSQVLLYEPDGPGRGYREARPVGEGVVWQVGEAPDSDEDRFIVMSRGTEPGTQVVLHSPGSPVLPVDADSDVRLLRVARGTTGDWESLEYIPRSGELLLGGRPPASELSKTRLTMDRQLEDMELADINGDGILDLVLFASRQFAVLVRFPGADLSPIQWWDYPGEGSFFASREHRVIIRDFDGDFRPDILISVDARSFAAQHIEALYFGDGTGEFPRLQTMFLSQRGARIAAGDVDEDGDLDLVQIESQQFIRLYRSQGDGSFDGGSRLLLPFAEIQTVALSDLDTDGHLDLLLTGGGDVQVLPGDGEGQFERGETVRVGGTPVAVVQGLFDEDGAPRVAVLFSNPNRIKFLDWDPVQGRFVRPQYMDAIEGVSLHAVDADGDGHLDLVIGGSTGIIQIYPGRGDGSFAPPTTRKYEVDLWRLADLDLDGKPEVIGKLRDSERVAVYRNQELLFVEASLLGAGREPTQTAVLDIDDDGLPDLAVANKLDSTVSLFRNEGGLVFSILDALPCGGGPFLIQSADLDRDGWADLTTLNEWTEDASILLRDPDGLFHPEIRVGRKASDMLVTNVPILSSLGAPRLLLLTEFEVDVLGAFRAPKSGCGYFGVPGGGPGRVLVVDFASNDERVFIRGDADADGSVATPDAVAILFWLFLGEASTCVDALDVDDSGKVQLADVMHLLRYLFLGGEPPSTPFPAAGSDPTEDSLGRCLARP